MPTPKLKCTTETIIRVEYSDLDKFIQEITGQKDYECVPSEEWGNDSSHRFTVDGDLSKFDLKDWNKFKAGGEDHSYKLRLILDGMCADKHIPAGIYLVRVCW